MTDPADQPEECNYPDRTDCPEKSEALHWTTVEAKSRRELRPLPRRARSIAQYRENSSTFVDFAPAPLPQSGEDANEAMDRRCGCHRSNRLRR